MKKVVYSVTRFIKGEPKKITGLGYITDKDLVTACISQAGKPYIRVFDDCIKNCHPIPDKEGENKGVCYEIREIEVESKNGTKDVSTIELEYKIWYKFVD